ncbi:MULTISPECIES: peptidase inhibitor family I36 protein [Streptomyces]|uniref:peptidase inhibitor family I36 protein n=1 Tax=Streptomyces TaxID=1883 RepID=UPI002021A2CC|nr:MULTISPECIES: peptidase inhibitor family I36 protein [Streptomyces]MCL7491518.1 peptidase inhibitor family I36 protein [Streptomyces sp. MCA2]
MRIRHIAAAGAVAAALTLGVTLPASAGDAQPSAGRSPVVAAHHAADLGALMAKRKVKVYQDANYRNRNTTFTEDMWDLRKDGWNDTISSAINQGHRTVTFYSGVKGHGASFSLAPGDREAHFGNRGMPDTTTSVMFR